MKYSLSLNAEFIDSIYKLWKSDPGLVSKDWQSFFEGFELGTLPGDAISGICDKAQVFRQSHFEELIYRYRDLGHLLACLDPLSACPTDHPLLSISAFKFNDDDLDRMFYTPHLFQAEQTTLREAVKILRETYCHSIGVEYMHLQDPSERRWLQGRMEPVRNRPNLPNTSKLRILHKLCQATLFEEFLQAKYIGQKRFSIEGAEVVVAMMDALVEHLGERGCREIILGMAHRGRLNIQVNVLGKHYEAVFCEFEDNYDPESLVGSGDVKYHKGYMADIKTSGDTPIRVLLVNNPSHLESLNPVLEGIARARQEQSGADGIGQTVPILIHGDAAFAGQGVVAETLNLSQLEGYHTGGTIHIVINNQIGFTTLPENARSTRYSTDIAKMLMVPIFHVHAEDPEAVIHVIQLACDYRMEFAKDVVVDVVCFRRYGHNEGDEPYYTQPQMYERIRERPPLHRVYAEKLVREGTTTPEEVAHILEGINQCLTMAFEAAHGKTCPSPTSRFYEFLHGFHGTYSDSPVSTSCSEEQLLSLARKLHSLPEGFAVHPRLKRILDRRLECVERGEGIDWATAEILAFASLLEEGTPVRLSGQDSSRGTFSQRHSVVVDMSTGEHYTPLAHLGENQAPFRVYDSMLSENAVLGFEYGYSVVSPHALVLWEAQFGDFANNAQVIIDQYISSAESKWGRLSGLVLLLPHAMEGQGPEHSSARLERFLQLCAEDNIQVCHPSTPAQYFHLLRRQVKRSLRKPLIILTPKSLLRHPSAVSSRIDFVAGKFNEVLEDGANKETQRRILMCNGKIYYDLLQQRKERNISDIAIVRIEQFYPFPGEQLARVVSSYTHVKEWFWVQDEPENMGGWDFVRPRLSDLLGASIGYIGRRASASPATGFHTIHKAEQTAIVEQAMLRSSTSTPYSQTINSVQERS